MIAKCILWWLLALVSVAVPIAGFVWVRRRGAVSLKPAWHGVAVQILFGAVAGSAVIALCETYQNTLTKLVEHPVGGALIFGLWEALALTAGCVIWLLFVLKDASEWDSVVFGMGMGCWTMAIAGLISGTAYGCYGIMVISGNDSAALTEALSTGSAYSVGMIVLQILRLVARFVMLIALSVCVSARMKKQGKAVFAYGAWLCYAVCCVLDDLSIWADTRIIPLQVLLTAGMVVLVAATGVFAPKENKAR